MPLAPASSFRQALTWSGVVMLVALGAMALAMGVGLRRADHLLDRLSRSQDQLVQVTRIEADLNDLIAHVAMDEDSSRREAAATADRIEALLREYRLSIAAEARRAGAGTEQQEGEAAKAQALEVLFADLRDTLLASTGPLAGNEAVEMKRRRFYALADEVLAGERAEVARAAAAMGHLRRTVTLLGIAILGVVALLAAAGAWFMVVSMVRPLRALEAATERAGRGERPAPVEVRGFSEFRRLASAFNRMDEQIASQRLALSDVNRGLEAQVAERTAQIEASRERLAEVDRTRRLFFSKVSHELRTPVTVIRGEAEVALRDPAAPAERLRRSLEHVVANGQFLQRRLDDLLTVARAEDGRVTLAREAVDLAGVVRQAVALAQPFARSSGVALDARLPAASGLVILGDPSWLQQALLALIDNAVKFAPGSHEIGLDLVLDGEVAKIRVADGGPGVDPADLPFLFESYYQAPTNRVSGGSGLGLAVARWVAEQHGGAISAQNLAEQGLVIEIFPSGGDMNILLIEDDPGIGRFVSQGLEGEGHDVEWLRSGREVGRRLAGGGFAAAILDLGLPDVDGLTLCRALRHDGVETPILMLTARDTLEDKLDGFQSGADDYLSKPFAFAELLARLNAVARRGSAPGGRSVTVGALSLDLAARTARAGASVLALPRREFDVLASMAREPGAAVSRQRILDDAWGAEAEVTENVVDVYVGYLRRRLAEVPGAPRIETVRGTGFRIVVGD